MAVDREKCRASDARALPRRRANAWAENADVPQCGVESLLRDGHERRSGRLMADGADGKGSGKQFTDRDTVIGQWDRSIAVIQFFGGIDSQCRVDGGVQIGHGDG